MGGRQVTHRGRRRSEREARELEAERLEELEADAFDRGYRIGDAGGTLGQCPYRGVFQPAQLRAWVLGFEHARGAPGLCINSPADPG
jgi:ribosome modulation factor